MATFSNLYVDQGSSFVETISVVDTANPENIINLNRYDVNAKIRKGYSSTTSVSFDVTIVNNNQIKLFLDAQTTASMQPGRYVYDVVVSSDELYKDRVQEGILIVSPGVTL